MSTTIQPPNLYICYGSETGNSKAIATRIFKECSEEKFTPETFLYTLDEFLSKYKLRDRARTLKKTPSSNNLEQLLDLNEKINLVIVCSTTGNGDPPQNADAFYRFIRLKSTPNNLLQNVNYAILGLGDSNYDLFNNAAISIDKRITELGGKRFSYRGEADEVVGLEQVVEPWIAQLYEALRKNYRFFLEKEENNKKKEDNEEEEEENNGNSHFSPRSVNSYLNITKRNKRSSTLLKQVTSVLLAKDNVTSKEEESVAAFVKESIVSPDEDKEEWKRIANYFGQPNICFSTITGARYLTTTESSKQVLHIELDISSLPLAEEESTFRYEPGDSIGILCENDEEHVQRMLLKLKEIETIPKDLDVDDEIEIKCLDEHNKGLFYIDASERITLKRLFTRRVDIMSPVTVPMLQMLAKYCKNQMEKNEILKLAFDLNLYTTRIVKQHANLYDVLSWFSSCKPPLNHLLQELQPIAPRYYSIASSPIKHPDEVHIAFSIVKYETPPPIRAQKEGCCTSWLQNKAKEFWGSEEKITLPLFLKKSPAFKLPRELKTPIIMIGPGTGVVPFRGFLQHRECMLSKKQEDDVNWLFYGCRSIRSDFLYHHEFRQFETSSFVNLNLLVASSREADVGGGVWYGGTYVQDYILEYASIIVELMMMKKACLYVCGDAQSMASQVDRVLHQIVEEECDMSSEEAKQIVKQWKEEGRYLKEVWC
ncbi:hypothetical protein ABK040_011336 [Willaertia magna]